LTILTPALDRGIVEYRAAMTLVEEMAVAVRPVPRLTTGRTAISPELSPISVVLSIPS